MAAAMYPTHNQLQFAWQPPVVDGSDGFLADVRYVQPDPIHLHHSGRSQLVASVSAPNVSDAGNPYRPAAGEASERAKPRKRRPVSAAPAGRPRVVGAPRRGTAPRRRRDPSTRKAAPPRRRRGGKGGHSDRGAAGKPAWNDDTVHVAPLFDPKLSQSELFKPHAARRRKQRGEDDAGVHAHAVAHAGSHAADKPRAKPAPSRARAAQKGRRMTPRERERKMRKARAHIALRNAPYLGVSNMEGPRSSAAQRPPKRHGPTPRASHLGGGVGGGRGPGNGHEQGPGNASPPRGMSRREFLDVLEQARARADAQGDHLPRGRVGGRRDAGPQHAWQPDVDHVQHSGDGDGDGGGQGGRRDGGVRDSRVAFADGGAIVVDGGLPSDRGVVRGPRPLHPPPTTPAGRHGGHSPPGDGQARDGGAGGLDVGGDGVAAQFIGSPYGRLTEPKKVPPLWHPLRHSKSGGGLHFHNDSSSDGDGDGAGGDGGGAEPSPTSRSRPVPRGGSPSRIGSPSRRSVASRGRRNSVGRRGSSAMGRRHSIGRSGRRASLTGRRRSRGDGGLSPGQLREMMDEVVNKAKEDFKKTVAAQQAVLLAQLARVEQRREAPGGHGHGTGGAGGDADEPATLTDRVVADVMKELGPAALAAGPENTAARDAAGDDANDGAGDLPPQARAELEGILTKISEVEQRELEMLARWAKVAQERDAQTLGSAADGRTTPTRSSHRVHALQSPMPVGIVASLHMPEAGATDTSVMAETSMLTDVVDDAAGAASGSPRDHAPVHVGKGGWLVGDPRSSIDKTGVACQVDDKGDRTLNSSALEGAILQDILDGRDRFLKHQSIAEAACVQETQRQQYELVNWLADAVLADIMEECTGEVSATIDGVADDLVEVL